MLKKIFVLAVALLISSSCFAAKIDSKKFEKALKDYADSISRVNYCMKELDKNNDSKILDLALTKNEENEKAIINCINNDNIWNLYQPSDSR